MRFNPFFRRKCVWYTVFLFGCFQLLFLLIYFSDISNPFHVLVQGPLTIQFPLNNNGSTPNKLILFWSGIYGEYSLDAWNVHEKSLDGCPYQCDYTVNRDLLDSSDALVFHGDYYLATQNPMPSRRKSKQPWIFYFSESPEYSFLPMRHWRGFFNFTMTYRLDSDIPNPYGGFEKGVYTEEEEPTLESLRDKKLVAWLVSSCGSPAKREDFVSELRKFIQVDVYGSCGVKCPNETYCMEYIGTNYKFYLSLENSKCQDYITEKLFNAYRHSLVPITNALGVHRTAPPGSYINIGDFPDTETLAKHLLFLDANPEEYLKYFSWRSEYKLKRERGSWCNLCTNISQFKPGESLSQSYDLYKWWWTYGEEEEPICRDNVGIFEYYNNFLEYAFGYRF